MDVLSKIFLVSCVAGKTAVPTQAADLYTSPWFLKARGLVTQNDAPWFILSAEHGLVAPETVIAPYNQTLNAMKSAARNAWATRVIRQMEGDLPQAEEVIVFAGVRYRENLMGWLRNRYPKVTVPMAGMPIGKQLSWLTHAKVC